MAADGITGMAKGYQEMTAVSDSDSINRSALRLLASLAALAFLSWGCVHAVVDSVVTIRFELEIRDSTTGAPVADASFFFLDIGLDQWRGNRGEALLIGHSDPQGRMLEDFGYSYGYTEGKPRFLPGEFRLAVEKEGCRSSTTVFNLRDLPRVGGKPVLEASLKIECDSP